MKIQSLFLFGSLLLAVSTARGQFYFNSHFYGTYGTITITGYAGNDAAVVIPDTINGLPVTAIGERAFRGDISITSITIPNNVTNNIGFEAFSGCSSLTNIIVDPLNSTFSSANGVLFNQSQTTLVAYPGGKVGSYTIPDSVTSIWGVAFEACGGLTSVTIPNSVTWIGDAAFAECTSLTNVTTGNGVTFIGGGVFSECFSLTSITIPNSVMSINAYAFEFCGSLANVTIGSGVTYIDEGAFGLCSSLTSITIPNSVTNIGDYAFDSCTNLTNFIVTPSNSAFSSADGVLFNQSKTTLVAYPGGKVGSYTIPDSVTNIRAGAFSGCTGLDSVTIPNGVTSIGGGAFQGCSGLTSVTIGNGVSIINPNDLFTGTSLNSVTIGSGVTNIVDYGFVGFSDLLAINVDPANMAYSSVDGVLFNQSKTTLVECPGGKVGSYTIPNNVTNIGDYAFDGCGRLTSVSIPDSVTDVGVGAFSRAGLTSVTIPNGVPNIGSEAFSGCSSLTSVTIPSSVTNVGDAAFFGCWSLISVYFQGNAPTIGRDVFVAPDEHDYPLFDPATGYFLPGTTRWGTNFGGLPTALWTPQVQTSDGSFGVKTNQFGFIVTWADGMSVVVEASPSLSNPVWSPLTTNALSGGSFYFTDPQWTNYPSRFYRVRSQ
jgi:hypothetical protein